MTRILCLGMSALDAIYQVPTIPTKPIKVLATNYTECGGGMAANASVAVARLGADVSYWGRVGNDTLGTRILGQLQEERVDVSCVRRVPGCASPSAAILIDSNGERLVCAFNDPLLDADASWLPLERVTNFDAVLADVRWPAGAAAILTRASSAGIPAVLDGDIGAPEALRSLAQHATHVVFSQPGLQEITGIGDPGKGLAEIARHLHGLVGVTLGPEGFLWRDGNRESSIPAPRVVAVDTLAAGDVWHGAFTLALGERQDVASAARFANAAAAIKCTRFGGRLGAPSRAEVLALIVGQARQKHM